MMVTVAPLPYPVWTYWCDYAWDEERWDTDRTGRGGGGRGRGDTTRSHPAHKSTERQACWHTNAVDLCANTVSRGVFCLPCSLTLHATSVWCGFLIHMETHTHRCAAGTHCGFCYSFATAPRCKKMCRQTRRWRSPAKLPTPAFPPEVGARHWQT